MDYRDLIPELRSFAEDRRQQRASQNSTQGLEQLLQRFDFADLLHAIVQPARHVPSAVTALRADGTDTETVNTARRLVQRRRQHPVTPYHADEWERLLQQLQLSDKYPTIVQSLRQGFDVGIGRITKTETPPNTNTIDKHANAYQNIIDKEFSMGRYLGPYPARVVQAVIGPFQSSPLSIIPKSTPGKFRAVHNFSYPYAPRGSYKSINHTIDPDQYPCTYGTFDIVSHIIFHLPPGSEASTRDISEAYRTIPIIPSQWPGLVVRLSGQDSYAINTNNNFGLSSAGGIFGQVADASADIFRASGIGPVSKWVDDYIFFRVPREQINLYNSRRREWRREIERNGGEEQKSSGRIFFEGDVMMATEEPAEFDEDMVFQMQDLSRQSPRSPHDSRFSYSDEDIDQISQRLGIPWEGTKTVPFRQMVKYIGFTWDLSSKTVSIPEDKRQEYALEILNFQQKGSCNQEDVQKLYGKLNWGCMVAVAGRAYMTSLETLLSTFSSLPGNVVLPIPREVNKDLEWWLDTLCCGIERAVPGPYNVVDMEAYSDASTEVGIGITIGRRWRAWTLLPGWKAEERDIGWAEAVGFEFLVRILCTMIRPGSHVRVYGDNQGIVEGWRNKGRSRNKPSNIVFRRIHKISAAHNCTFVTRYVRSKENPADGPSRGVYPPIQNLLPRIPIPHELRRFIADSH